MGSSEDKDERDTLSWMFKIKNRPFRIILIEIFLFEVEIFRNQSVEWFWNTFKTHHSSQILTEASKVFQWWYLMVISCLRLLYVPRFCGGSHQEFLLSSNYESGKLCRELLFPFTNWRKFCSFRRIEILYRVRVLLVLSCS